MSRWIDAEWLKNEMGETNMDIYTDEVKEYIAEAPSIDIVRCKECIHWAQAPKTERGWCDKCDGLLEPTFFCADGERSKNGK